MPEPKFGLLHERKIWIMCVQLVRCACVNNNAIIDLWVVIQCHTVNLLRIFGCRAVCDLWPYKWSAKAQYNCISSSELVVTFWIHLEGMFTHILAAAARLFIGHANQAQPHSWKIVTKNIFHRRYGQILVCFVKTVQREWECGSDPKRAMFPLRCQVHKSPLAPL